MRPASRAVEDAYRTPIAGDFKVAESNDKAKPGWCRPVCYVAMDPSGTALSLTLRAPTASTVAADASYSVGSGATPVSDEVSVPKFAIDDSLFSVVIGTGTLLTSRGAVNYHVLDATNSLSVTSIGRNNVDLIVGGAFNLGVKLKSLTPDVRQPLSAFVSLKFTPGSDNSINGFVFGGGYQLTKYLSIVAGLGLTPRQEPSIGLRRVAFDAVLNNPSYYKGFIASDLLLNRGQAPFDGFPLLGPEGRPIYNGDPLVNHYRTGAFMGIAFPLKLKASFTGK